MTTTGGLARTKGQRTTLSNARRRKLGVWMKVVMLYVFTNEEMALHLLICDKQLVSCPDCGLPTAKDMLAHHLSEICLYKGIYCLLGCGEILPRYFVILLARWLVTLVFFLYIKKREKPLAKPWLWMKQMTGTKCSNREVIQDLLMLTRESEELANWKHSEFYECWNYIAFPLLFHLKYRKCVLTLVGKSVKPHPFERKVTWPFIW